MKHREWGFTVLRGPGSSLSSRQRSCEYFLLSDPYLCLKVLLYKPQHASSWIKTSSPAASVTACLQNVMLLKKRGNLEQNEPLCPVPNHSELLQTQKGKEENLLRLVKQNNATSFFFISSHIFLSLFSHPMGSTECWERWEGGCKRRKEWGRDDKKARAHKSKQTNRIKPGLKAVRRQRTERQDYDRSSAAQRTAGWWSNTGAAGPPQHVHGGPGGQSERKKPRKKAKDNCFAHPFGGSCDHSSCETRAERVKVWLQRAWLYEHPAKGTWHREGPYMTIPWVAQSQGLPQVGTHAFVNM